MQKISKNGRNLKKMGHFFSVYMAASNSDPTQAKIFSRARNFVARAKIIIFKTVDQMLF